MSDINSARKLARLIGRSHTTINDWTQRPDWPFRRRAPWRKSDLPKIRRWMATVPGQPQPLHREDMRELDAYCREAGLGSFAEVANESLPIVQAMEEPASIATPRKDDEQR